MFAPLELELLGGCEPPCRSWKSNSGPLEENYVLLTTEIPPQPLSFIFLKFFFKTINKTAEF